MHRLRDNVSGEPINPSLEEDMLRGIRATGWIKGRVGCMSGTLRSLVGTVLVSKKTLVASNHCLSVQAFL